VEKALILLKATAFGIRTQLQGNAVAIGPIAFGSAYTPEIGQTGLIIGIAFEILAENDHRLAAQIQATGTVR
jgi:hypothetical protein